MTNTPRLVPRGPAKPTIKAILITLGLLLGPGTVYAGGQYATLVRTESTGDPFLSQCEYETLSGLTFHSYQRGICATVVKVDPETLELETPSRTPSNQPDRWQSGTLIDSAPSGDPFITKCTYRTLGGFRFTVNQRGLCKYSMQMDAESLEARDGWKSDYSQPAPNRWQTATLTGSEATPDMFVTRCYYRTLGGYAFSTNRRGLCPYSVQVDPEANVVR